MMSPVRSLTAMSALLFGCALSVWSQPRGLPPAQQVAEAGLPRLTEFMLRPGEQPFAYS